MCKEIEKVIMKHNGLRERPGMVIAFTCEPDWNDVHWIANIQRPDAVHDADGVKKKMTIQSN